MIEPDKLFLQIISTFWKHTGVLPSTFVNNYRKMLKDGGIFYEDNDLWQFDLIFVFRIFAIYKYGLNFH